MGESRGAFTQAELLAEINKNEAEKKNQLVEDDVATLINQVEKIIQRNDDFLAHFEKVEEEVELEAEEIQSQKQKELLQQAEQEAVVTSKKSMDALAKEEAEKKRQEAKEETEKMLKKIQEQQEKALDNWGDTWEAGLGKNTDILNEQFTKKIKDFIGVNNLTQEQKDLVGDKKIDSILETRLAEFKEQMALTTTDPNAKQLVEMKFAGLINNVLADLKQHYAEINKNLPEGKKIPIPQISVKDIVKFIEKECGNDIEKFMKNMREFLGLPELEKQKAKLVEQEKNLAPASVAPEAPPLISVIQPGEPGYDPDKNTRFEARPNTLNSFSLLKQICKEVNIVNSPEQRLELKRSGYVLDFCQKGTPAFSLDVDKGALISHKNDEQTFHQMLQVFKKAYYGNLSSPAHELVIEASPELRKTWERVCENNGYKNVRIVEAKPDLELGKTPESTLSFKAKEVQEDKEEKEAVKTPLSSTPTLSR